MNLYCIVFSPTRTSAKIAEAVAFGINSISNPDIHIIDVTHEICSGIKFTKNDLVIISAPVYGGGMPPIAKKRMDSVLADRTPCVLISVYGNRAFEHSLSDMAEFATDKGFIPVAAGAFVGEHSYSTPDTPIAAGRPDACDLAEAEAFGQAIAGKLKAGDISAIDITALKDIPSPDSSLANFRTFVMDYQRQQKESPKKILPVVDAELCSRCGICVESCPTQAIGEDCISVDAARCIKCCACVKICPENARTLESPFAPVLSANFNIRKSPVWTV